MALTLLLGGVRAGKSARALALAAECAGSDPVLFVATAQAFDDEMRRRIDAHRRERPAHWITLESPLDVASDLETHLADRSAAYGAIVVDCLTLWVSNVLLSLPQDADVESHVAERARRLLGALGAHRAFVVSNEVGLGVVPPTPLGRRYRDALGRANQVVAAAATDVRLLVAGIELPLKPPAPQALPAPAAK
jgi:adenosylcobinamide kinase/adenosylcobinamide-phosphate guanylyltransferase